MNVYILKILVSLQIVFDVNLNFIEQFPRLRIQTLHRLSAESA